jgi:hypothetical protein
MFKKIVSASTLISILGISVSCRATSTITEIEEKIKHYQEKLQDVDGLINKEEKNDVNTCKEFKSKLTEIANEGYNILGDEIGNNSIEPAYTKILENISQKMLKTYQGELQLLADNILKYEDTIKKYKETMNIIDTTIEDAREQLSSYTFQNSLQPFCGELLKPIIERIIAQYQSELQDLCDPIIKLFYRSNTIIIEKEEYKTFDKRKREIIIDAEKIIIGSPAIKNKKPVIINRGLPIYNIKEKRKFLDSIQFFSDELIKPLTLYQDFHISPHVEFTKKMKEAKKINLDLYNKLYKETFSVIENQKKYKIKNGKVYKM